MVARRQLIKPLLLCKSNEFQIVLSMDYVMEKEREAEMELSREDKAANPSSLLADSMEERAKHESRFIYHGIQNSPTLSRNA